MILSARKVLSDCELALELLEYEEDHDLWRIHWVGSIALLRAVGHVLQKVDGKRSRTLAACIKERYSEWKRDLDEHMIFRDFIEHERNFILKEYEFNAEISERTPFIVFDDDYVDLFSIDGTLYRPLLSGPYANDDARDTYRAGLDWWARELKIIEDCCRE